MAKKEIINVQGTAITVITSKEDDYISLTDMANAKTEQVRAADIIKNWIRTRTTLEFLGAWEQLYNPGFKVVEFDHFKMQAGLLSFVLSNMESINALLIRQQLAQGERLVLLNKVAITQMQSLVENRNLKRLK